tara:strand:+ start:303 stop:536 length:234 start_codon:yes stop_codon:yes gene_type:complete
MSIYIVVGTVRYEPDTILKAFTSEQDAEDFVVECRQYEKLNRSTESGWTLSHPAIIPSDDGECYGYHNYHIREIELT